MRWLCSANRSRNRCAWSRIATIDPYLVVPSPITGRVTARAWRPGDFVQPGNVPAPYSVADISRIWMNASVTESDMPLVRKGQPIHVAVMAFPGRVFDGEISMVGASVDPESAYGLLVRAEIEDPKHELLPGMFASFVIVTGDPVTPAAVPLSVVREGNGTMTVWVTTTPITSRSATVKLGLQNAGYDQILDGSGPGEQVVTKGAVYLDILTQRTAVNFLTQSARISICHFVRSSSSVERPFSRSGSLAGHDRHLGLMVFSAAG
jgi:cobalt-zinc-cadmium efflux system membrane fusion protein